MPLAALALAVSTHPISEIDYVEGNVIVLVVVGLVFLETNVVGYVYVRPFLVSHNGLEKSNKTGITS